MPLGVWESQNIFAKIFQKKHFPTKKNFFSKKTNKKTYIFPTPGPAQRMPLGVFGVKKVAILGGGEFAVEKICRKCEHKAKKSKGYKRELWHKNNFLGREIETKSKIKFM